MAKEERKKNCTTMNNLSDIKRFPEKYKYNKIKKGRKQKKMSKQQQQHNKKDNQNKRK